MKMNEFERQAFERLLELAQSDTGQARIVADFVLAWWNAKTLGGFDPADLSMVDSTIAADIATIIVCLARNGETFYPTEYRSQIRKLIEIWRPEIWAQSQS